jgi:hypothetical protein
VDEQVGEAVAQAAALVLVGGDADALLERLGQALEVAGACSSLSRPSHAAASLWSTSRRARRSASAIAGLAIASATPTASRSSGTDQLGLVGQAGVAGQRVVEDLEVAVGPRGHDLQLERLEVVGVVAQRGAQGLQRRAGLAEVTQQDPRGLDAQRGARAALLDGGVDRGGQVLDALEQQRLGAGQGDDALDRAACSASIWMSAPQASSASSGVPPPSSIRRASDSRPAARSAPSAPSRRRRAIFVRPGRLPAPT